MNYSMKSKRWALLFVLPFVACFILFWLAPLVYGIFISLFKWNIASGNNGFVGLDNYKAILTSGTIYNKLFINGLKNTFIFVLLSVPPLLLVSLGLALIINYLPSRWKTVYRTVFFMSYSVSVTAVSAIFLWLFNGNGGFVNNVLMSAGMDKPVVWLNTQPYAWITILITTIWWTIGFNMMLFLNAIDEVDEQLYEAAGLDGAGAFKKFWYVTFPEIRNISIFIMITTVIASFNLYGQTKLITAGGPEQSTSSLIMNIQQTVFDMNQLGIGSAMAILMGLIMMCVTGAQYWLSYRNQ
ncbi:sugar ABC transporter permease [Paenibacillus thiaminolyticus]|uniref:Sugar ABC transporter permease n=1 Tax=Paenibacillus thiaminolyticus TaxID=49283 RepID=A0AAP9DYC7_PANTH|nr:sugar ABC transporter permease [Paenibacillus thiaminolyticus]MCY9538796.1 sugar ABC transporter permease [Paenibacillus thiaminolyticus]MCY9604547.1 sugar ABC transporter permease [Paenibacillus thiaminolyticus]MCY9610594.1 sugar ABC transporter permease [Paenibacillus thiaminolyticus]MCY9614004.1 sugar ABC transporter permease [Paenibacillus thiaminolyticus]MCY9618541.1 sugar ABC transporter permease [Paenibacillus thiaminolyticus]